MGEDIRGGGNVWSRVNGDNDAVDHRDRYDCRCDSPPDCLQSTINTVVGRRPQPPLSASPGLQY